MASKAVCRSCLRALRQHSKTIRQEARSISYISRITHPVAFTAPNSTPHARLAALTSVPNQTRLYATESPVDATGAGSSGPTPSFADDYIIPASTEVLFKECASQADYTVPERFERGKEVPKTEAGEEIGQGSGWWYEDLSLTPTFNTWAQITYLHIYLLTVRLRYFPSPYSATWQQHLSDHFFYECEHRMTLFHGLTSRAIRNRYLKDINNFCRGAMVAYDEGLLRGDAVLAAAIWRNIWAGKDDVDWEKVTAVVAFMRRALKGLDGASDTAVAGARLRFGNPGSEIALVAEEAAGMKKPFGAEDEEALREFLAEAKSEKKRK